MSRRYYYKVHLEPKSHAKSKKRREQEKFKSRYNESSKVYRFIETVEKKTSIERIKVKSEGKDSEWRGETNNNACLLPFDFLPHGTEWALLMVTTLTIGNPSSASHLGARS